MHPDIIIELATTNPTGWECRGIQFLERWINASVPADWCTIIPTKGREPVSDAARLLAELLQVIKTREGICAAVNVFRSHCDDPAVSPYPWSEFIPQVARWSFRFETKNTAIAAALCLYTNPHPGYLDEINGYLDLLNLYCLVARFTDGFTYLNRLHCDVVKHDRLRDDAQPLFDVFMAPLV